MRKFLILIPIVAIVVCLAAYLRFASVLPASGEMDALQNVRPVSLCSDSAGFPGLARNVSQISKGKSGYFEKDEFAGRYATRDIFINDWYGKHLKAMGEPSLIEVYEPENEVYRFLWLRTFHRPIVVRVERSLNSTKLVFVELSGAGGYEPGSVVRKEERTIGDGQWCDFLTLLAKAGYWKLGDDYDDSGNDGAQWILEGVREGRYHLVDRWTPDDGDYRAACIYLLNLSGIDTDKLGGDLY